MTLETPSVDLIVAHHEEDLKWLRRVPTCVTCRVYHKGSHTDDGQALPNVGREAHTYLHHIVHHYDTLADRNIFCQGRPFDHVPEFHRLVGMTSTPALDTWPFLWLGFVMDWDDSTGSRLFQTWSKNPERRPLPMQTFWPALWQDAMPQRFLFFPGAHFIVTREQVHTRPRSFYRQALDLCTTIPDSEHCFERCWARIFNAPEVDRWAGNHTLPIYFRPISRLKIGWDDVAHIPGHPLYG